MRFAWGKSSFWPRKILEEGKMPHRNAPVKKKELFSLGGENFSPPVSEPVVIATNIEFDEDGDDPRPGGIMDDPYGEDDGD